jgi:hypothetical protein
MSTRHTPPRQNVHRARSPVTTPTIRRTVSSSAKTSQAVRNINTKLAKNGNAVRPPTVQQGAALAQSGSKTY